MRSPKYLNRALAAISLFAACIPGCSDNRPLRVPVAGTVLVDGQPLRTGFVRVVPNGARAAFGEIGPDGRFRLTTYDRGDGCVPGSHATAVIAFEVIDSASQRWLAPIKYRETATSGLTIDITEPTENLVINLTWDGGKPFVERPGGTTNQGE